MNKNTLTSDIYDNTYVFLDLETSGKYPISSEICEIAAVKWQGGKFIDEYHTLIKPKQLMSEEVIKIHNITNEMVVEAPAISDKLPEFRAFIDGSVCVAHHAPFDLGFLSYEMEKINITIPNEVALCTSLLGRSLIQNITNHRLQTLVKYFHLDPGQAHRALDDAKACAHVFLNLLKKYEIKITTADLMKDQNYNLHWNQYSMNELRKKDHLDKLVRAVEIQENVSLCYSGGSIPGQFREVKPISVVRNPEGDFLVADDFKSKKLKRYYISKVTDCQPL